MYRIDNATAATSIPTPAAVGPNPDGFFTKGNPSTSTLATIADDDWFNSVQEEICNVITDAGATLSKTTRTQLRDSYKKMVQKSAPMWALDSGAANAYVVTLTPAPTAYVAGLKIIMIPSHTNTTASTINVNGLGVKSIKRNVNVATSAGDIIVNGVYQLVYDGTNFQITSMLPNLFKTINTVIYNAPGTFTYTPSPGLVAAKVEVCGAGASGGSAAGGGAGTAAAASGGGPGGYIMKFFLASAIGASQTVTVGAKGAAPAAGNHDGTAGGDSSFGALMTGQGGNAGSGCASSSSPQFKLGAASGQGLGTNDFIYNGTPSGNGIAFPSLGFAQGGQGGQSYFGGGTQWSLNGGGIANPQGAGTGGGGASATTLNTQGGAGTDGLVIITEYISQ